METISLSSSNRLRDRNQRLIPSSFVRKVFYSYGEFCAVQPWEVIVATLTLLVSILTVTGKYQLSQIKQVVQTEKESTNANDDTVEVILMTVLRCLAVFHCYYHFKKIYRLGSTLILKVAAIYLLFTTLLYSLVTLGLSNAQTLKSTWFLILLLVDMPKVTEMAQFILSSSQKRIGESMAHGMASLGPGFAFDTLGKVMLVYVGALTGISKVYFFAVNAVLCVLINFLAYFSFFPAGLSLALELSQCKRGRPSWDIRQIIATLPLEIGPNSDVNKVRVIAIASLSILHIINLNPLSDIKIVFEKGGDHYLQWLNLHSQQLICVIIVITLAFRFTFYDNKLESKKLRRIYLEGLTRKFELDYNRLGKLDVDVTSNSTDEGVVLSSSAQKNSRFTAPRLRIMSVGATDDSSCESTWSGEVKDPETQTTESLTSEDEKAITDESKPRNILECSRILQSHADASILTDEEIIQLVGAKIIRSHALEIALNNHLRGVKIRRKLIGQYGNNNLNSLDDLPYLNYDYNTVLGACCESVVGYMTIPVGVVGPLKLDGKLYHVPMATTEGCLVASTNRGCSALSTSGVVSQITDAGITRAPILSFPSIVEACQCKSWMEKEENFSIIKSNFDSTSRFARLQRIKIRVAGRLLYARFVAKTGDAMGMNMISKATEFALIKLNQQFPNMQIISLSGNMCTDKKPSAINWIEGRGKSVVCEAVVPAHVIEKTLKTSTAALIELNNKKNLVGSALAGSIGGFNAHASNIVTAIFIATGQDVAQNIGSSNCLTQMEAWGPNGLDLYITCTMPSIEVGTVGGGTVLNAQSSCLQLLGVKGPHLTNPGQNAQQLARIVCATVLAGELSLMSALAAGHLVKSHLRHNRSSTVVPLTDVSDKNVAINN